MAPPARGGWVYATGCSYALLILEQASSPARVLSVRVGEARRWSIQSRWRLGVAGPERGRGSLAASEWFTDGDARYRLDLSSRSVAVDAATNDRVERCTTAYRRHPVNASQVDRLLPS